ncbi:MAG: hypothetical protein U9N83_16290 [Thermodesulfobacteriota bacterium]|nr:hypothetical protein [Thermodesulfobacteriota bacterium]
MKKGKQIEKDIFINTEKNRNSEGHWYFEFGILARLWHGVLNFMLEIWDLFVIWYLEFGISKNP